MSQDKQLQPNFSGPTGLSLYQPLIFSLTGTDFFHIMNISNTSGFVTELEDQTCDTKQLLNTIT